MGTEKAKEFQTRDEELAAMSKKDLTAARDEYAQTVTKGKPNGETHRLLAVCNKILGK